MFVGGLLAMVSHLLLVSSPSSDSPFRPRPGSNWISPLPHEGSTNMSSTSCAMLSWVATRSTPSRSGFMKKRWMRTETPLLLLTDSTLHTSLRTGYANLYGLTFIGWIFFWTFLQVQLSSYHLTKDNFCGDVVLEFWLFVTGKGVHGQLIVLVQLVKCVLPQVGLTITLLSMQFVSGISNQFIACVRKCLPKGDKY